MKKTLTGTLIVKDRPTNKSVTFLMDTSDKVGISIVADITKDSDFYDHLNRNWDELNGSEIEFIERRGYIRKGKLSMHFMQCERMINGRGTYGNVWHAHFDKINIMRLVPKEVREKNILSEVL